MESAWISKDGAPKPCRDRAWGTETARGRRGGDGTEEPGK